MNPEGVRKVDATAQRTAPALVSIVIPVYNEEEVVSHLKKNLSEVLGRIESAVELVLVNDGSADGTVKALQEWASQDNRVRVISLSRNFGHQPAATAGLDQARGDAIVLMDADLQDPPELILEMLTEYRRGFDVVYAQRIRREGESAFKRISAWCFYRVMRFAVYHQLPPDTGDFRLISRSCLDVLRSMRETHRFLRGMVAWVGFAQTAVRFARPRRVAGETKYPLRKMIRFAWTAMISFSPLPLRMIFGFGFFVAALGFGAGAYAITANLMRFYVVPGWTSLMLTTCLIGSFILIALGVIGEYVAKIYEEVKGRPIYVIDPAQSRGLQTRSSRE